VRELFARAALVSAVLVVLTTGTVQSLLKRGVERESGVASAIVPLRTAKQVEAGVPDQPPVHPTPVRTRHFRPPLRA
jgi:hypothetical protein